MQTFIKALRHYIERFNYTGILVGLVFFCFSMLPSLLPRPAMYQAIISGISLAIGYGLGTLASTAIRWLVQKELPPHFKATAWRFLSIAGALAAIISVFMGGRWQDEVRQLVGEQASGDGQAISIALGALGMFIVLITLSRGLRRGTRWLNKKIALFLPHRVSVALGATLVIVLTAWLVSGVFANFFISTANSIYSKKNNSTPDGVSQPLSPYRSGSNESLAPWDTLGY